MIPSKIDHPQANELETISRIIDSKLTICEHVTQDLCNGRPANVKSGAHGMAAEQVLRAVIAKTLFVFTYNELVSIHKWSFCPISALRSKNYPRNINHMPAVIFFASLDLEQKSSFMDGHELAFHMVDSQNIRRFCLIGIADKGFKKVSAQQEHQGFV